MPARGPSLPQHIEQERRDSPDYGGRSVYGHEVRADLIPPCAPAKAGPRKAAPK